MLRRDLLRLFGVTPLALPLLSACGSSSPGSLGGRTEIGLVASDVKRDAGDASAATAAAVAIRALAESLYAELAQELGNLAYSPYSIAVALAMTVNGARGKTAEEMLNVLSVTDLDAFNGGLNALTQYLEGLAGEKEAFDGKKVKVTLDAANSLWGQQGVTWEKPFLDVLARDYGTGMRTVDYIRATEDSRRKINAWTAEQTRDKIKELIPQGVLNEMTRLVLVNAIYLKAPWLLKFEEFVTEDGTFHGPDGDVTVPFMTTGGADFSYRRGSDWQAARLMYAGSELAMAVVLPDDIEAFHPDLGQLLDWSMPDGVAGLYLPRWKVRTQSKLKEVLMSLGMPTAFGGGADFSGMTADEVLEIADVLHEAYVAVDEEGTEAAAATAVLDEATSARADAVTLTLDRPFLFIIHDTRHGTPLFVGRVDNPSQEG